MKFVNKEKPMLIISLAMVQQHCHVRTWFLPVFLLSHLGYFMWQHGFLTFRDHIQIKHSRTVGKAMSPFSLFLQHPPHNCTMCFCKPMTNKVGGLFIQLLAYLKFGVVQSSSSFWPRYLSCPVPQSFSPKETHKRSTLIKNWLPY